MKNKIDIEKAKAMRAKGMTYTEIAGWFGVTGEAVRLALKGSDACFRGITPKQCCYKGIREWMNREQIRAKELTTMMGYEPNNRTVLAIRRRLDGSSDLRISDIRILLRLSGLTFEEAFGGDV